MFSFQSSSDNFCRYRSLKASKLLFECWCCSHNFLRVHESMNVLLHTSKKFWLNVDISNDIEIYVPDKSTWQARTSTESKIVLYESWATWALAIFWNVQARWTAEGSWESSLLEGQVISELLAVNLYSIYFIWWHQA